VPDPSTAATELRAVRLRRWGRPLASGHFAVVDVETTGLDPGEDRIIEVAVVTTDARGRVTDEWSTLVDPGRDAGPTDVHGITDADLVGADDFAAVAQELAHRLDGTVLVAHNLAFDSAFLAHEQRRIGVPGGEAGSSRLTTGVVGGLCTLELSRRMLPRPADGWSLGALCAMVGVPLLGAHRALVDARATAGLLAVLLAEFPTDPPRFLGRRLTVTR
jgi:DNA polymerase III epsilon subunit family exonuclease